MEKLRSVSRSRPSIRAVLVAIVWLATIACAAAVFAVRDAATFAGSGSALAIAGLVAAIVTNASVGAVLTIKRPGNVVGRVLMLGAILPAITVLGWVSGAAMVEQRGRDDVLAGLATVIGAIGFIPSVFVGAPLLALVFPNGRLPGPRWKWAAGAFVAAIAAGSAVELLHPGPMPATVIDNPFGLSGFSGSEAFWTIGRALVFGSLPASLLLAVAAVIVRVRRSRGVERAQVKWFVAANLAVVGLVTIGFADGGYLGLAAGETTTIFDVLAVASLSLPAIAVGVAILRYRLFEIDRIISRTLSWALVTGLLGVVFVGLLLGLQALAADVIGGNTLAVAGSTLAVAALAQPLRRRVQAAVDRRFNRARYDAQRTVETFAEQLRDEVDLGRLRALLIESADAALSPVTVGVWLRGSN